MDNIIAVIVTYNIQHRIIDVYKSLKDQVNKIIFIDNASDEITRFIINNLSIYDESIIIKLNETNLGIAAALNIGIKIAEQYNPTYIMTLDHDSILASNMVKEMLNIYEKQQDKENICIISPAIFDINKGDFLVQHNKSEFQYIEEPIQSGAIIKANVFKDIGYFNEILATYYVDTEFDYRLSNRGYKFLQCNNVKLLHEEGRKTKHIFFGKNIYYQNYSEYAIYYRAKNYVYMMRNYYSRFSSKNRIIIDIFKILIFDKYKIKSIKSHFKGIYDGLIDFLIRNNK